MKFHMHSQRGFTLIELMIAMVLGVVVVGAAGALFITNRKTYTATEAMSRVQENARTSFEMMSRDIREAGGNPCGVRNTSGQNMYGNDPAGVPPSAVPIISALSSQASYQDPMNGVLGYSESDDVQGVTTGAGANNRVAATDAILLTTANSGQEHGFTHPSPTSSEFSLTSGNEGDFTEDDIVFACDSEKGWIFQVTNVNTSNGGGGNNSGESLVHNTGSSLNTSQNRNESSGSYAWKTPAYVTKVTGAVWYVGCNGRNPCGSAAGRSLYRAVLNTATGEGAPQEVTEGVDTMGLTYLVKGQSQYIAKSNVTDADWPNVTAVRVALRLAAPQRVEGSELLRTFTYTVALRNRI